MDEFWLPGEEEKNLMLDGELDLILVNFYFLFFHSFAFLYTFVFTIQMPLIKSNAKNVTKFLCETDWMAVL